MIRKNFKVIADISLKRLVYGLCGRCRNVVYRHFGRVMIKYFRVIANIPMRKIVYSDCGRCTNVLV